MDEIEKREYEYVTLDDNRGSLVDMMVINPKPVLIFLVREGKGHQAPAPKKKQKKKERGDNKKKKKIWRHKW